MVNIKNFHYSEVGGLAVPLIFSYIEPQITKYKKRNLSKSNILPKKIKNQKLKKNIKLIEINSSKRDAIRLACLFLLDILSISYLIITIDCSFLLYLYCSVKSVFKQLNDHFQSAWKGSLFVWQTTLTLQGGVVLRNTTQT